MKKKEKHHEMKLNQINDNSIFFLSREFPATHYIKWIYPSPIPNEKGTSIALTWEFSQISNHHNDIGELHSHFGASRMSG